MMNETISNLIATELVSVDLDDTIKVVIETLDTHKLSCVPVVDSDGKCFGVISSPDLVHFQKMKINPKAELAWEVCTHNFIELSPKASINEAVELMVKNKIHHIIISENNSLKGILSSLDIIESCFLNKNA